MFPVKMYEELNGYSCLTTTTTTNIKPVHVWIRNNALNNITQFFCKEKIRGLRTVRKMGKRFWLKKYSKLY